MARCCGSATTGPRPPTIPSSAFPDHRPEVYSLGHRNHQGLAFQPGTGALWVSEHAPQGGDEVNVIEAGRNYGWPIVSYSRQYSGQRMTEAPWRPGMELPAVLWVPSIAPSGLAFYDGDRFPDWKGNLFAGSLRFGGLPRTGHLERIVLNDAGEELRREWLLAELRQRIRDVRSGTRRPALRAHRRRRRRPAADRAGCRPIASRSRLPAADMRKAGLAIVALAVLGMALLAQRPEHAGRALRRSTPPSCRSGCWRCATPDLPGPGFVVLQPPDQLRAHLFNQIFNRTMESMTSPTVAAMPLLLHAEYRRSVAVLHARRGAAGSRKRRGCATIVPDAGLHRCHAPARGRQHAAALLRAFRGSRPSLASGMRWPAGRRAAGGGRRRSCRASFPPIVPLAASDAGFASWWPLDPDRDRVPRAARRRMNVDWNR